VYFVRVDCEKVCVASWLFVGSVFGRVLGVDCEKVCGKLVCV